MVYSWPVVSTESPKLAGKVALVTGGGRGIGKAIAIALADKGMKVGVCGRTESQVTEVATEIKGDAFVVDLASRENTDTFLNEVEKRLGTVDVLVNNAGIAASAPYQKVLDADWDRMMEVNCVSAFRLARSLVPKMVKKGWGRVVNIASNAGVSGYGYTSAYCASKHAMVGFTRALAVELAGAGVTVNAVCPGWVETQMAQEAAARIASKSGRTVADAQKTLEAMSPQGRMIQASEVAHWTVSLCMEEGRGVHGQTIVIDGGQILK